MQAIILKCAPLSQYHFGQVAVDADTSLNDTSDFIHSDTLFSALINLTDSIFPNEIDLVLSLMGKSNIEPKLRLSSAFYCLELNGQILYFLPKPLNSQLTVAKEHKELKKIQFISKGVWEKGLKPDVWIAKGQGCKVIQKTFVVTDEEYTAFKLTDKARFYGKDALPKVAIHKLSKENSFYYQTNIQIGKLEDAEVHFYFLMNGWDSLNDNEKSIIDILLKMLPSVGIGGKQSTGCGNFIGMEKKTFSISSEKPTQFVTLSLTNPANKDEFASFQQFDIVKRGGRRVGVAEPNTERLLKRINMITEGSVINKQVKGRIQDISPDEKVLDGEKPYLRSGICFSLPY